MNSNFTISIGLSLKGASEAAANLRKFTDDMSAGLGKVSHDARSMWQDLNGFSVASKLMAAAGGAGMLKNIISANLDFQRDLLEMKQTADMSTTQMLEAKKHILESSSKMLQTPGEMLEGLRAFTTAGEKYDFALAAVDESARAATAFFSRPIEIANMDVDLKQKMALRADELKAAHNMLLGHARSGRYETKAMSMDAPRTLNTMAQAGMTGIEGVNMMGALTQRLMKLAPTTQPAEVATYMEHFLSHLTQPHYVKGLQQAGIDIKKYMPGGKFGGVDTQGNAVGGQKAIDMFLAFLDELNRKGLKDPFEMGKAGFREMYTQKAAMQSLQDVVALRDALKSGQEWAKQDLVGAAFAEIKEADFGKVKAAEIEVEKAKMGETSTQGAHFFADLLKTLSDHKGEALGASTAILGMGMLYRFNNKRKARLAGSEGAAASVAAGGIGGMPIPLPVYVVNKQMSLLPEQIGGHPNVPGTVVPEKTPGKMGNAMRGLGMATAAATGWEIGYNVIGPIANEITNAAVRAITGNKNASLGTALYDFLHKEKEASVAQGKQEVKGRIDVHVLGPASIVNVKTQNSGVKFNAYAGYTNVTS